MVGKLNVRKQKDLEVVLHDIFHGSNILKNVRSKADIKFPSSSYYLELDFWIPELKLSFEFQDPYHYETVWYANAPLIQVQKKDEYKKTAMSDRGETLVTVPCWWDGERDSLIATIRQQRPDLFKHISLSLPPIDKEPPDGFFKALDFTIPDVGKLMIATYPTPNQPDPQKWWMSEKYDGTRVCWHAKQLTLYTRMGTRAPSLSSPAIFSLFPSSLFLDGELWFGRNTFNESQKLFSKKEEVVPLWENLRYLVFDSPSPSLLSLPFEHRLSEVYHSVDLGHAFIIPINFAKCKSKLHLGGTLHEVLKSGGEGIVIRLPESLYDPGRSASLIKFKASRDQEALVISVGDICSLQLANGQNIKATVAAPNVNPQVDDIVTISFKRQKEDGRPVIARIYQIRKDVKWDDVIRNHEAAKRGEFLPQNRDPIWKESKPRLPSGHWTDNDSENLRNFFSNFAQRRNFDPLVLENWVKIPNADIAAESGTTNILAKFGSLAKSLAQAFPEVADNFAPKFKNYWAEVEHRRGFFDAFAKKYRFDPLIVENWYPISRNKLEAEKGISVIKHSQGGLATALAQAYPNLHFDASRFHNKLFWHEKEKVKMFFVRFAESRGFSPLDPEAWYRQTKQSMYDTKGGATILSIYGSFNKALSDVFPYLNLDDSLFNTRPKMNYWQEKANRRAYFDTIAQSRGLDPLSASSWQSVTTEMVQSEKKGTAVLRFYNNSLANALIDLYPEIDFQEKAFVQLQKTYWKNENNRKLFFDSFARNRNFDPLVAENWYAIKKADILQEKGHTFVLQYYHGNYVEALVALYPDIGLNSADFTKTEKRWNSAEKRRIFFDNIASALNFDPLLPENWYSLSLQKTENISSVLYYHNNSVIEALIDLYPEVCFDESQFSSRRRNFWTPENKRNFLLSFAKKHGFDPFDVTNWLKIKSSDIIAEKGKGVLSSGPLLKVLQETFPELKWNNHVN